MMFDKDFRLLKEDNDLLLVLCCYFIQDQNAGAVIGLDINKGLLISGPVGCGKTTLMNLMPYFAWHKIKYELIPNYGQYTEIADSRCFQKLLIKRNKQ